MPNCWCSLNMNAKLRIRVCFIHEMRMDFESTNKKLII